MTSPTTAPTESAPETPDPVLSEGAPAPVAESAPKPPEDPALRASAAPSITYPDGDEDEPPPLFDISKVRETIQRSKVTTREEEEKALQAQLESQARKLAAGKGDAPASAGINHKDFLDDLHDGKVRNFDDIFARFPIGDGEFEVYVERKAPRRFRNKLISGIQRAIKQRMNHHEFAEIYGSGSYLLTVYGPTPSGRLDDLGKVKRRPFTKPVRVDIPDPYDDNPPNPEMAVVATPEFEDDDMLTGRGRRIVGGATDADAHIREVELQHQDAAEERRLRMEEDQRERDERRREEERRRDADIVTRALDAKDEELRHLREELRDLRQQPSREETSVRGVAELLQAVKPEASHSEVNRLTQELSEVKQRSSEELRRADDRHRQELDRVIREKDEALRLERQRADDRIRENNELSHRREQDLRSNMNQRIADEQRQHDRDMQMLRESNMMMGKTEGSAFTMQLEVKQQEINRLQAEKTRLEHELDAERKRTIADRVNEFAGAAEALGFTKEDGERNWKDTMADAAIGLMQHAPNLVSAIRGNPAPLQSAPRPMALPPHPQQQMMPGMPGMPPMAFATDGVEVDLSGGQASPPLYPGQDPLAGLAPQGPPATGFMPPQAAPQPQIPAQEEDEEMGEGDLQFEDSQIVEFSGMFRQALDQKAPPEEFARGLVQQMGALSGEVVRQLPLQRVLRVLEAAPGGDEDPLVRREGKQFLAKVWQSVEEMTQ